MPRTARIAPGGVVYHVLNRAAGRFRMLRTDRDFLAFEHVLLEAHEHVPGVCVLAWCVLPNHWHFVVRPTRDGELSAFFRRLAHTHAMRWRVAHRTVGYGPLYQGRFKSFPVQYDRHLTTVIRYVERNALTAGLVRRAEAWRWGSLWVRGHGEEAAPLRAMLAEWPVPREWVQRVNEPITPRELERLRASVARGRPYGDEPWTLRTAARLRLGHTLRPPGRPPKAEDDKQDRDANPRRP